jgi:hypothetical protein
MEVRSFASRFPVSSRVGEAGCPGERCHVAEGGHGPLRGHAPRGGVFQAPARYMLGICQWRSELDAVERRWTTTGLSMTTPTLTWVRAGYGRGTERPARRPTRAAGMSQVGWGRSER